MGERAFDRSIDRQQRCDGSRRALTRTHEPRLLPADLRSQLHTVPIAGLTAGSTTVPTRLKSASLLSVGRSVVVVAVGWLLFCVVGHFGRDNNHVPPVVLFYYRVTHALFLIPLASTNFSIMLA